ncbi:MAG TPA: ankyrin repeat domain-containing protein, partial [Bryobacteraceae bacterium]|nr:ankyrin repeat domain-containing protein [Bryobacteraceae bacterium]
MRGLLPAALLALLVCAAPAGLHEAVKSGNIERVRALLDAGADVNGRDRLGGTPLHEAIWNGNAAIAALLIERGADVNARHTEAGSTPLHYAVITGRVELVRLL